jgi:thiol-disulfide isomerase/thioredoxin
MAVSHALQTNQSAPELQTTGEWKNSKPLTLAELRGKYVLLDFWGHWCGPCVRRIPSLMAIHEQFPDQGLVILGIHDASVGSIAEMDEKLVSIRKQLWMDHDINYAVAIDRPDPAKTNTPNPRASGATATAYGIERFPTLLLINPAGQMLGEFHATNLDAMIAQLEKLLHLKAGPPAWQTKFDQLYRLEGGNLLRCIREPFIPQRKEFFFYYYIRSGLMERAPARVALEAPVSACFVWDAASQAIADVRQGPKTLLNLLGDFGFHEREIEGAAPLLERRLPGDWIFARRFPGDRQTWADGEREALLTAFAQTLKHQFQLSLRFTSNIVSRDAYKATGTWKLTPLGGEYSRYDVHLFSDKPDPPASISGGGGSGSLDQFLSYLGPLGRVSFTNATGRTHGGQFSWRQHSSAGQAVLKSNRAAFQQLLTRVSQQTGLRFEKVLQPERRWTVEKGD